jgi:hypothetical protein
MVGQHRGRKVNLLMNNTGQSISSTLIQEAMSCSTTTVALIITREGPETTRHGVLKDITPGKCSTYDGQYA